MGKNGESDLEELQTAALANLQLVAKECLKNIVIRRGKSKMSKIIEQATRKLLKLPPVREALELCENLNIGALYSRKIIMQEVLRWANKQR